ncbi:DEAD/DEAH box helicase [Alphaproteobacteria bacterium]|nr:DEAD/DEAH box helicase [Alphaproteobacteria bacterium]
MNESKPEHLPQKFNDILIKKPEGFNIKSQYIDPFLEVIRINTAIEIKLGGHIVINKKIMKVFALSNEHNWVFYGSDIYPLPTDIKEFITNIIGDNKKTISYSNVLKLFHDNDPNITIHFSDNVFISGAITANQFEENFTVPGLKADLYPYQSKGVQFMKSCISFTGGVILADEMGLGKTMQIISLLLIEKPSQTSPALIICPTSLIANWAREIETFAPSLDYIIHRGPDRTGVFSGLQKASIVISTYDTVVNDIFIFTSFKWHYLILDEAQALKNPQSQRRKLINTIDRLITIPVTGTPMENRLLDLWSLVDLTIPNLLGKQSYFEDKFDDTVDSASMLNQIINPVILKRLVMDVANDLPERIDIDIPINLTADLSKLYIDILNETLERYPKNGALVATTRLQIFCANPSLQNSLFNEELDRLDDDLHSETNLENVPLLQNNLASLYNPKLELTKQLIEEAILNKDKILIFALYNNCGAIIKDACVHIENMYWNFINGSTPQVDRQNIIDEFTDYDGPACLILNPKAAGAGLNITSANVVIHYTQYWNPATEMQASARAHRRGQTKPVRIYKLFYKDTVEEIMIERALWKRSLGDKAIPISFRNNQDLKNVLIIQPRG